MTGPDEESAWDEPVQEQTDEASDDEPSDSWPEAIIPAQEALEGDMPGVCRTMAKAATKAGWKWRVTYAMGTIPQASNRWKPGEIRESYWFSALSPDGATLVQAWWEGKPGESVKAKHGQVAYAGVGPFKVSVTVAKEAIQ